MIILSLISHFVTHFSTYLDPTILYYTEDNCTIYYYRVVRILSLVAQYLISTGYQPYEQSPVYYLFLRIKGE